MSACQEDDEVPDAAVVNGVSCTERLKLPAEMQPRGEFNAWNILKNCVGKELTRIAIPVCFNEPLSFLQRICEYLEYSELLFQAESCDCPRSRLELISAFAVSAASSNWDRLGKPFNPLLGETYELDCSSGGGGRDENTSERFRMVCEQVSHHPPISAFHAEATDGSWSFHGSVSPRLGFWGKSLEVSPKGRVTLEFPRRGEAYTWQNVQCKIHGIFVGKPWIEHFGDMTISCHGNGSRAELSWHPASWLNPSQHRVDGYVFDEAGQKTRAIYGKWVDAVYSLPVESWKLHKRGGGCGGGRSSGGSSSPKTPAAAAASSSKSLRRGGRGSGGGGGGLDAASLFSNGGSLKLPSPLQFASQRQSAASSRKAASAGGVSDDDTDVGGVANGVRAPVPAAGGAAATISSSTSTTAATDTKESAGRGSDTDLRLSGQRLLWWRRARPADSARYYYSFTHFAMQLNDASDAALMARLPPTDCRRKPDLRALEAGDLDLAQEEKSRLEEKQRRRRSGSDGVWFRRWRNPHTGKDDDWLFTGDYWARDWARCPDIY